MRYFAAALFMAATLAAPINTFSEMFTAELPQEPPIINNDPLGNPLVLDATYDWRQNFFYIFYDLYKNGNMNYMTARRVLRNYQNEYSNTIVEPMEYPLFYWFDINGDGKFKHEDNEMWVDPEEDGVNGNEQQYHIVEEK